MCHSSQLVQAQPLNNDHDSVDNLGRQFLDILILILQGSAFAFTRLSDRDLGPGND